MTTPLEAQLQRVQDYAEGTPHIGTLSTLRRLHELTYRLHRVQKIAINREENQIIRAIDEYIDWQIVDDYLDHHLLVIGALCWKWGAENDQENAFPTFQTLTSNHLEKEIKPGWENHNLVRALGNYIGNLNISQFPPELAESLFLLISHVCTFLAVEAEKEGEQK